MAKGSARLPEQAAAAISRKASRRPPRRSGWKNPGNGHSFPEKSLTGENVVIIIGKKQNCAPADFPGKAQCEHHNSIHRMMKPGDTAQAEPKGLQKLSGKRTGFGRNSGKRRSHRRGNPPRRRIFQVRLRRHGIWACPNMVPPLFVQPFDTCGLQEKGANRYGTENPSL